MWNRHLFGAKYLLHRIYFTDDELLSLIVCVYINAQQGKSIFLPSTIRGI